MRGGVDLGDNGDAVVEHPLLISAVIVLGIVAVGCGQALHIAFQTEDKIIVLADIIDMQMDLIELEISIIFCNFLNVFKRQISTRDVNHPAADGIIRIVPRTPDRYIAVCRERLHRRDQTIKQSLRLGCGYGQVLLGDLKDITVLTKGLTVGLIQPKDDVAILGGRRVVGRRQLHTEQISEITKHDLDALFERLAARRINDDGIRSRDIMTRAALPLAYGRNDRGRRVRLTGSGYGHCAEQHRRAKGCNEKTFHTKDLLMQIQNSPEAFFLSRAVLFHQFYFQGGFTGLSPHHRDPQTAYSPARGTVRSSHTAAARPP